MAGGWATLALALVVASAANAQQTSRMSGLQLDGDQPIDEVTDALLRVIAAPAR